MSGSEKFKQYQEKRKGKAQTWDEMVKKSKVGPKIRRRIGKEASIQSLKPTETNCLAIRRV